MTMHETLWTLLQDPAHWGFEVISSGIQDVAIFLAIRWYSRREHRIHNMTHKRRHGK